MDLDFFHLLKSVAETEEKHAFKTQTYDVASLELKYPQNIITVAPPAAKAPPPLPGETRVTKLSDAVHTAFLREWNGGPNSRKGCSIVVHEGVYVDSLAYHLHDEDCGKDFALEIVGVKNVRLILERDRSIDISVNLTLKNILIFDRRLKLGYDAIYIDGGAVVEFIQVKIHSPRAVAINLDKSTLSLRDSAVVESAVAIFSNESVLHSNNTVISSSSNQSNLVILFKTNFEAKKSSFSSNYSACLLSQTKANIENCTFDGPYNCSDDRRNSDTVNTCLRVCAGSSVFLRSSIVCNFQNPFHFSSSDCKIIADSCIISNYVFAFLFSSNAHGLIKNCQLLGHHHAPVAVLSYIVKGKIRFQSNRLAAGVTAKFLKDSESALPLHDFVGAKIELYEKPTTSASRAERSASTQRMHAQILDVTSRGESQYDTGPTYREFKYCNRCLRRQQPSDDKMKYCVNCSVCYCSKECQRADWGDHKLECQSP